jgi:Uma2 family endonuclease
MEATTLVSVEEYLNTSYPDGDREYVDGAIVERNLGTTDHAYWQSRILFYLMSNHADLWSVVEARVQVKATRFRIPDVTCLKKAPETSIVKETPFLVVEVLSPDDRAQYVQEKVDDYLSFGISYIWVVNPHTRRGYVYTADGMHEAKDRILRTSDPEIALPLDSI